MNTISRDRKLDETLPLLLCVLDYLGGIGQGQGPSQSGRLFRACNLNVQELNGFGQR